MAYTEKFKTGDWEKQIVKWRKITIDREASAGEDILPEQDIKDGRKKSTRKREREKSSSKAEDPDSEDELFSNYRPAKKKRKLKTAVARAENLPVPACMDPFWRLPDLAPTSGARVGNRGKLWGDGEVKMKKNMRNR